MTLHADLAVMSTFSWKIRSCGSW